jgi:hypothetical protein
VGEEAAVGGVLLGFVDGDGVGVCSWGRGVLVCGNDMLLELRPVLLRNIPPTSTPMRMHLPPAGEVMLFRMGLGLGCFRTESLRSMKRTSSAWHFCRTKSWDLRNCCVDLPGQLSDARLSWSCRWRTSTHSRDDKRYSTLVYTFLHIARWGRMIKV